MDKQLISLNETNIMKVFAMFQLSQNQKDDIDNEKKDEIAWIIDNWNELRIKLEGPQHSKGLIELNRTNIIKIIGGCQIAVQRNINEDDIPAYVVNMFEYLEIQDKGYYRKGNEIFLKKTDTSLLKEN